MKAPEARTMRSRMAGFFWKTPEMGGSRMELHRGSQSSRMSASPTSAWRIDHVDTTAVNHRDVAGLAYVWRRSVLNSALFRDVFFVCCSGICSFFSLNSRIGRISKVTRKSASLVGPRTIGPRGLYCCLHASVYGSFSKSFILFLREGGSGF